MNMHINQLVWKQNSHSYGRADGLPPSLRWKNIYLEQESIPVGCIPQTCQRYMFWWPPLGVSSGGEYPPQVLIPMYSPLSTRLPLVLIPPGSSPLSTSWEPPPPGTQPLGRELGPVIPRPHPQWIDICL